MGIGARSLSKWIVRFTVALLLWPPVAILFVGQDGWETRLPGLNDREITIARSGVLFEHATQLFLWILVLVVNEASLSNLRHFAILSTVLWLAYAGVWGLQAFFVGCEPYGLCLEDAPSFQWMSFGLIFLMLLALGLSMSSTSAYASQYQPIAESINTSLDEEGISDVTVLNERLRKALSDSKDKEKLIAKLGKKLKSLLAENEKLRSI